MKNQPATLRRKLLHFTGCLLAACAVVGSLRGADGAETADIKKEEAVLLQRDAEFSKLSADKGMQTAFVAFMTDDGTILAPGTPPIVGKEDIRDLLSGNENTRLIWKPLKAEVSRAGDMGYTYGSYESRRSRKDGTTKVTMGKYVTIWRKQADGVWKAKLDIGDIDPESIAAPSPRKTP